MAKRFAPSAGSTPLPVVRNFKGRLTPVASSVRTACLPAGLALFLSSNPAFAGPTGGVVAAGQGSIATPDANTTTVNQASHNLVLDWQTFNLSEQEVVQFNQPGTTATALNRINDQNPSQIFGSILANGNVILLNPSGVFFSPTAHLNVHSLTASSLDIKNEDFMSGKYIYQAAPGQEGGPIINQGEIEAATGGSVTLMGGAVSNEGVIVAHAGQVNLVAGNKVTVDFNGDGLMQFTIDKEVLTNTQALDAAVKNTGTIDANGGTVLMAGSAAAEVFSSVVNNAGIIRAGKIENQGGVIRLIATGAGASVINTGTLNADAADATSTGGTIEMTGANVTQSGTVSANAIGGAGGTINIQSTDTTLLTGNSITSATSVSGKGGKAHVLGNKVGLLDMSTIDVSGALGGGEVLVGGDRHGDNPDIQNASRTYVSPGSIIRADAIVNGNGGKVIVWSDEVTRFYGSIYARGGAEGGDGGFVETSGAQNLAFSGAVNVSAPSGTAGVLLLDPDTINVNDTGTPADEAFLPDIFFADGGAVTFNLSDESLEAFASGTIILQATTDINFNFDVNLQTDVNIVAQAGNNINFASTADLVTLGTGFIHIEADSPHSGSTGSGIIDFAANAGVHTDTGAITLIANDFTVNTTNADIISTGGGNITIARSTNSALTLGAAGQLTDGELDRVNTSGTLTLGKATTRGTAGDGVGGSILTASSIILDTDITPASVSTVHLTTSGGVDGTTGGIVVTNLAITAGSTVDITDANTNVTNLAISSSGGSITFQDTNAFTIADVDGVFGIDSDTGSVSLTASNGGITVNNTSAASGNDIEAVTGITINLPNGDDTTLTINAGADVENLTSGGVTVNADEMVLTGTIHATGQTVTLRPRTGEADAIRLGANPGTGDTLELDNTELDNVFATTLVIGSSTAGAITIDVGAGADITPGSITNLHLITGSGVTGTAGGIVVTNLAIEADSTINITDATTDVVDLAVLTSGDALTFVDTDDLNIGTVDSVVGINTGNENTKITANGITQSTSAIITADDLTLVSTGGNIDLEEANDIDTLSVNAGVNNVTFVDSDGFNVDDINGVEGITAAKVTLTATTGNITVTDTGVASEISASGAISLTALGIDDDIILNTGGNVSTTSGGITFSADDMDIKASVTATGQTVTLKPTANIAIEFEGADSAAELNLTDAELDLITATTLVVGKSTAGAITVSGDISPGSITNLHLITGSSVTGTLGGIVVTKLAIEASDTVSITDATTDVTTLAIDTSDDDVTFNDADDLTIGTVDGITGVDGKNITLFADGGNAGDLTINEAVTSTVTGADVFLNADNTISFGANGDVTTDAGDVTVRSDFDASGVGAIVMNSGSSITSNDGDIVLGGGLVPTTDNAVGTATNVNGVLLDGATLSADAGKITIHGAGADVADGDGIEISNASLIQTTTGKIDLTGTAGLSAGLSGNLGVYLKQTAVTGGILSAGGTIDITGTAGGGITGDAIGVLINGLVKTSGAGDITIKGTSGIAADTTTGVAISGTVSSTAAGGNINIIGTAGVGANNSDGVSLSGGTVESLGAGDITITGTAGTAPLFHAWGVAISGDGTATVTTVVTSSGTGDITITGTGGTAPSDEGLVLRFGAVKVESTGAGNIVLDGTSIGSDPGLSISTGTGTSIIGNAGMTGDITLRASTTGPDSIIPSEVQIIGKGNLYLEPGVDSDAIGIVGGAGVFNLSKSELDTIQDGFNAIIIGSATGTGLITFGDGGGGGTGYTFTDDLLLRNPGAGSSGITIDDDLSVSANDLGFDTGGSITHTSGTITTSGLLVQSVGAVSLSGLDIDKLAASVTGDVAGAGNSFSLTGEVDGFAVDTVTVGPLTLSGVTTADVTAAGPVTTGDITLGSTGNITFNQDVITGDAKATVAGNDATSGSISIDVGTNYLTGLGSLFIGSATASGGASTAQTGDLSLTAGEISGDAPSPAGSVVPLSISMATGTGGGTANKQGLFNATATGAGLIGEINVSSSGTLNIGVLDTKNADTTNVKVTLTTAGDLLTISGSSDLDTDNVVFTADDMDITGTITAANSVTLRNTTLGRDINLGTDFAGRLGLSNTELGKITATTLRIGRNDASASDEIIFGADIDVTATVTNLHLITGGNISTTNAIKVSGLAVEANYFASSGSSDIDTLAGVSSGDSFSFYNELDGFSVGSVDGVNGVDSFSTVFLNAFTGNLTITDTAAANDVNASGTIDISVNADDAFVKINSGANVETDTDDITIIADEMDLQGTITNTDVTAAVILKPFFGDSIDLGSIGDVNSNTLELDDSELKNIFATTLRIGSATAGLITVSADVTPLNVTNLHLINNDDVDAISGGVIVDNLAITSSGTVTFTVSTTNVDTMAAFLSGPGMSITFKNEADGFTVGAVDLVVGVQTANVDNTGKGSSAYSGDILLLATKGGIIVDEDITTGYARTDGGFTADSGDIFVFGNDAFNTGGVTVNTGVKMQTGYTYSDGFAYSGIIKTGGTSATIDGDLVTGDATTTGFLETAISGYILAGGYYGSSYGLVTVTNVTTGKATASAGYAYSGDIHAYGQGVTVNGDLITGNADTSAFFGYKAVSGEIKLDGTAGTGDEVNVASGSLLTGTADSYWGYAKTGNITILGYGATVDGDLETGEATTEDWDATSGTITVDGSYGGGTVYVYSGITTGGAESANGYADTGDIKIFGKGATIEDDLETGDATTDGSFKTARSGDIDVNGNSGGGGLVTLESATTGTATATGNGYAYSGDIHAYGQGVTVNGALITGDADTTSFGYDAESGHIKLDGSFGTPDIVIVDSAGSLTTGKATSANDYAGTGYISIVGKGATIDGDLVTGVATSYGFSETVRSGYIEVDGTSGGGALVTLGKATTGATYAGNIGGRAYSGYITVEGQGITVKGDLTTGLADTTAFGYTVESGRIELDGKSGTVTVDSLKKLTTGNAYSTDGNATSGEIEIFGQVANIQGDLVTGIATTNGFLKTARSGEIEVYATSGSGGLVTLNNVTTGKAYSNYTFGYAVSGRIYAEGVGVTVKGALITGDADTTFSLLGGKAVSGTITLDGTYSTGDIVTVDALASLTTGTSTSKDFNAYSGDIRIFGKGADIQGDMVTGDATTFGIGDKAYSGYIGVRGNYDGYGPVELAGAKTGTATASQGFAYSGDIFAHGIGVTVYDALITGDAIATPLGNTAVSGTITLNGYVGIGFSDIVTVDALASLTTGAAKSKNSNATSGDIYIYGTGADIQGDMETGIATTDGAFKTAWSGGIEVDGNFDGGDSVTLGKATTGYAKAIGGNAYSGVIYVHGQGITAKGDLTTGLADTTAFGYTAESGWIELSVDNGVDGTGLVTVDPGVTITTGHAKSANGFAGTGDISLVGKGVTVNGDLLVTGDATTGGIGATADSGDIGVDGNYDGGAAVTLTQATTGKATSTFLGGKAYSGAIDVDGQGITVKGDLTTGLADASSGSAAESGNINLYGYNSGGTVTVNSGYTLRTGKATSANSFAGTGRIRIEGEGADIQGDLVTGIATTSGFGATADSGDIEVDGNYGVGGLVTLNNVTTGKGFGNGLSSDAYSGTIQVFGQGITVKGNLATGLVDATFTLSGDHVESGEILLRGYSGAITVDVGKIVSTGTATSPDGFAETGGIRMYGTGATINGDLVTGDAKTYGSYFTAVSGHIEVYGANYAGGLVTLNNVTTGKATSTNGFAYSGYIDVDGKGATVNGDLVTGDVSQGLNPFCGACYTATSGWIGIDGTFNGGGTIQLKGNVTTGEVDAPYTNGKSGTITVYGPGITVQGDLATGKVDTRVFGYAAESGAINLYGFYSGSGTVTVNSGYTLTTGNATAADDGATTGRIRIEGQGALIKGNLKTGVATAYGAFNTAASGDIEVNGNYGGGALVTLYDVTTGNALTSFKGDAYSGVIHVWGQGITVKGNLTTGLADAKLISSGNKAASGRIELSGYSGTVTVDAGKTLTTGKATSAYSYAGTGFINIVGQVATINGDLITGNATTYGSYATALSGYIEVDATYAGGGLVTLAGATSGTATAAKGYADSGDICVDGIGATVNGNIITGDVVQGVNTGGFGSLYTASSGEIRIEGDYGAGGLVQVLGNATTGKVDAPFTNAQSGHIFAIGTGITIGGDLTTGKADTTTGFTTITGYDARSGTITLNGYYNGSGYVTVNTGKTLTTGVAYSNRFAHSGSIYTPGIGAKIDGDLVTGTAKTDGNLQIAYSGQVYVDGTSGGDGLVTLTNVKTGFAYAAKGYAFSGNMFARGQGVTVNGDLVTGNTDTTTAGKNAVSGGIRLFGHFGSGAAVKINGAGSSAITGDATSKNGYSTTGAVVIVGEGVTNDGAIKTGTATATVDGFNATSGKIDITADDNTDESGAFDGAGTVTIGGASVAAGGTADIATTGDLILQASEISGDAANGVASTTPLKVFISEPTGANTLQQGLLHVTATGSDVNGEINVTSSGPLSVGFLDTKDSDTTNVKVTVTGGNLLTIVNSSDLDIDDVVFTADHMKVANSIIAATATLRNESANRAIDLGSTTDAAPLLLELSDTELDQFTVDTLFIGRNDGNASGLITVTDDINPDNTDTLHLITGGKVTTTTKGIIETNLAIEAGDTIDIVDGNTDVDNLAIDAGTSTVTFTDANGLSITTVDGIKGITSGILNLNVTTGDLTVVNTTAANDINATGAITITLKGSEALFTINTSADVETNTDGIIINADKMDLQGTITDSDPAAFNPDRTVDSTVTLRPFTAANAIDLGVVGDGTANTLELSDAELDRVNAKILRVGSLGSGTLTLSSDISPANITDLHLIAGTGITGTSGGVVHAGGLALESGGTINFTDTSTDIDTLAIFAPGQSVSFFDTDGFTVGTVDGIVGITVGGLTLTNDNGIGLGATTVAGGLNITDAELGTIFVSSLTLTTKNIIRVDGITDGNSTNANAITLNATGTGAGEGFISFINNASVFNDTLTANAAQGMDVNQNLTSTTGALTLDGDTNNLNDAGPGTDDIAFAAGVVLTAGTTITLDATTGKLSGAGALDLLAQDGITINDNLTTAGITTLNSDTVDFGDNVGTLTVANGATVNSGGFALNITADDLNLNASGKLNSGAATTTITDSDGSGIGLGGTPVAFGLNISDAELNLITANALVLNTAGNITVDGITDGNSTNANAITLNATGTGGGQGFITFATTASTFNDTLTAKATQGIVVNKNVTSTTGALTFDGDSNNTDDGADTLNDNITFASGVTLTAGTTITLDATTGKMSGGVLDLLAKDGITVNDSLTTTGILTLNADTDQPDNVGTLTVANGATVGTTGGFALNITANDLNLNASGKLDSGAATTTINDSDGTGIGLGGTTVAFGLNISDAELNLITANALVLNTKGNITVDGITDGNSTNANAITLNATGTGAGQGFITFATNASVFDDSLTANAAQGMDVNKNLTSTTGALVLDGDANNLDDPGTDDIAFAAGVTLTAGTTITLDATTGKLSGAGALDLLAQDGITINDNLTTAGITTLNSDTVDFGDNVGTLTVANGATVNSGGFALNITADDLNLNASGKLNSGAATTTITDSDGSGIGLGGTPVAFGLNISDAELNLITANALVLNTAGNITVDGITDGNSTNANAITLNATGTGGGQGFITFATTASTFNDTLTAKATQGIVVNKNVTSTTGALTFDGDSNNTDDGADTLNDNITFASGVTLTAGTTITLDATTGKMSGGVLDLLAKDGITVNDSLTTTGILTLNADTDQPDNVGTLTVANGATVGTTGGFALNITANDLNLNASGKLDSGAATTTINDSDGTGIGLGGTTVAFGLNISDAELNLITANALVLNTKGNITVDGITDGNSTNANAITLNATGTGAGQGFITFATNASVFNDTLTAKAAQGMDVNKNLTSTTGALVLDGDANNLDDPGTDDIAFASGVALTAGTTITLDATTGKLSGAGALDLLAQDGITINDNLTTAGITTLNSDTVDFGDNVGTLTVANGATVNSGGFALNITADDLNLNASGKLNSGAATTTITVSDGGSIGLGNGATVVDMRITGAELQNITATGLTIGGTNSTIVVDGVTAANSDNVAGTLTLDATNDNATIQFTTATATFNDLFAKADDGITVNADITTDTGALALDGDFDNAADTSDAISFNAGRTLTSETSLTLDATTGKLSSAAGTLDLVAKNGVTINDNLTTNGITTIDNDSDTDGTGDFILATGVDIKTNDNLLQIFANDVTLDGTLNSGTATTIIKVSDGGSIGLGNGATVVDMRITGTELQNITAGILDLSGTNSTIFVDGVTATDSNNVGVVVLDATNDNANVVFNTATATFNALGAAADDGITVDVDITTDTAGMVLEGDFDNAADTNDDIQFNAGRTLTSAGIIKLDATTGKIDGAGTLTLDATKGITINDDLHTVDTLIMTTTDGPIDVSPAKISTDDATITFTAGDAGANNGTITIGAGGVISNKSTGATITLDAADGVALGGDVDAGTAAVSINADTGDADTAGAITWTSGTVTGSTVTLKAATGIRAVTSTTSLSADNTTSGTVDVDNSAASTVSVTSLTTAGAGSDIIFDNTGNVALDLTGAVSAGDAITINNTGDATTDTLTIDNTVTSTGGGTININTLTRGDILVNSAVTSSAGTINLTSSDNITIQSAATNINAGVGTINLRVDNNNDAVTTLDLGGGVLTGGDINLIGSSTKDDTLIAQDQVNAWVITGSNSGTLDNINFPSAVADFTDFANLTGGTSDDTFSITSGSLTGRIDGDRTPGAGYDKLDYSGFGAPVSITLTDLGSIDGFQGNATNLGTAPTTPAFDNINVVVGSGGSDSLTGLDTVSTWDIDGSNTYTDNTSGNTLDFSGFEILNGGADDDTFKISTNFGTINGNDGINTYNVALGGPFSGTINSNSSDPTSGDVFIAKSSIAGTVNIQGNATWDAFPGVILSTTAITGTGKLDVRVDGSNGSIGPGPVTIGPGALDASNFGGFTGHLIIGGSVTPMPDTMTTPDLLTIVINADPLTVGTGGISTGGNLTLLGKNIILNNTGGPISAGGPGGAELTIVAIDGAGTGTISAPSGLVNLDAGSGFFVADGSLLNSTNMVLNFSGGPIEVAQKTSSTVSFGAGSNATGQSTPTTNFTNLLANLQVNFPSSTFNTVQISIIQPATTLTAIEQLGYIDTGLFEQDLTLFGVIGNGIALALSQCEEIEGCAPNVTEEELNELIAQLEARIEELTSRCDGGDAKACALLDGFKEELSSFMDYRQQLQEYVAGAAGGGEEEVPEELKDEFGGEAPPATQIVSIEALAKMLEGIKARISWLESLKTDPEARAKLGEKSKMQLTQETLDAIIEGAKAEAQSVEQQIAMLREATQASVMPITPKFVAEAGDYNNVYNLVYGPSLLMIDSDKKLTKGGYY